METIIISPVSNGWIINVGCMKFVSENKEKMFKELSKYIDDPKTMEKEYRKNSVNEIGQDAPAPVHYNIQNSEDTA